MSRRLLAAALTIVAAAVGFCSWRFHTAGDSHGEWKWILIAWLYTAAGLFAWQRRPDNRTGMLMTLSGLAFWLWQGEATRVPLLWTIGSALDGAWVPMLAYLLLSFPNGHLSRRLDQVLVVAACLVVLQFGVIGSFFYDPRAFGCADCQPHLNLFLIHPSTWYVQNVGYASDVSGGLTLVVLTLLVMSRWWGSSRPGRRVLSPVLLPAAGLLLAVAAQQAIQFSLRLQSIYYPTWVFNLITNVAVVAGISLPVSFALGLWLAWVRRGRVSDLVLELGELPALDRLEAALSRALGDPSLAVGRWDPQTESYLTSVGKTLKIPESGSPQVATFLEREGKPLAAVVHDAALLEDRGLLDSVSAAARLAVENERLQAELRAQLEEVRASRSRIVAATDAERHRLERDLHDGAQQRLVSLTLATKVVESRLGSEADPSLRSSLVGIAEQLALAVDELRELARGIHPSVLTEDGLGPALQSLAERSAVPARLLAAPQQRFMPAVEAAAYFVVSEALANVAKHAHASQVTLVVRQLDSRLLVEVTDDGIGGADPARGSGLSGLADRVAAVDGQFEIASSPGEGTRVAAEIPCGSS